MPVVPSMPDRYDGVTASSELLEQIGSTDLRMRKLRRKQKRFIHVFLLTLIMAFSPSKALGFIGPFIIIAALILYVQIRPKFHLKRLLLFGIPYLFGGLVYWLLMPQFFWPNYLLAVITYASAFFLLFDFSQISDAHLLKRLGQITLAVIVVQSIYGIAQFIWMVSKIGYNVSIGDYVWGTLAPPADRTYAGTSSFFVLLISTLQLFVFAVTPPKIPLHTLLGLLIVAVCWVLASMVHSIVFFAVAVVAAILVSAIVKPRQRELRKRRRGIATVAIILILVIGVGSQVHTNNFRRIQSTLSTISTFGPDAKNGKLQTMYNTIFELPHQIVLQPIIGVGPGQYSSRAALIATGEYLTRASIPFLPKYTSALTERYILPVFHAANSTISSPNSSWVTLYGELGIIGTGIVAILLLLASIRFSRFVSPQFPRMSYALLILVYYLFLMGFQDVYWEYTQGIFPAILLLKLYYDYVRMHQQVRVPVKAVPNANVLLDDHTNLQMA